MGFVIVIAIAVLVGVLVYRLTDGGAPTPYPVDPATSAAALERTAEPAAVRPPDVHEWAGGDVGSPAHPNPPPPSGPHRVELSPEAGSIPVVGARQSWHARLGGALGLLVAVGVGAIAIAGALYVAGTFVAKMISNAN